MKRFIIVALIFVISNAKGSDFLTIKIRSSCQRNICYLPVVSPAMLSVSDVFREDGLNVLNSWSKHQFFLFPGLFRNRLKIEFEVSCLTGMTGLKIMDGFGRTIRTLLTDKRIFQSDTVIWDGKDRRGLVVDNGLYFCCLTIDNLGFSHKLYYIPFRINKRKISGFRMVKRLDRRKNIRRY